MSHRPLGFGSRAGTRRPLELNGPSMKPKKRIMTTHPSTSTSLVRHNPTKTTTISTTKTTKTTTTSSRPRRGFGLFDSDDSDVPVAVSTPIKSGVKFSGDVSGFGSMRELVNLNDSPVTPGAGSRKSTHTTPSRPKSARESRRQTPYAKRSTAALALQRAGHSPGASDEDALIGDTMAEMSGDESSRSGGCAPQRYMMKGAKVNSVQREEVPKLHVTGPLAMTWREWLNSFVPEIVRRPVIAILGSGPPAKVNRVLSQDSTVDEERTAMSAIPGSFEETSQLALVPATKEKSVSRPKLTHIPSETGLFEYENAPSPALRRIAATPIRAGPPSHRASPHIKSPPRKAETSFIERMKSARSTRRYDPTGRASRTITPQSSLSPPLDDGRELTAEEELELIERRRRERKVQEAEDRYRKRDMLRRLGRENEISDSDSDNERIKLKQKGGRMKDIATSPIKNNLFSASQFGKTGSLPQQKDEAVGTESTTPPSSPPRRPIFTSNLFANKGKSTSTSTTTNPFSAPITLSSGPTPGFNIFHQPSELSKEPTKEDTPSAPPPPPSPSHRQLPAPQNGAAPSVPPAPSVLFPEKPQPIGGFGLSDPTPTPIPSLARQRLEKHKPRVSSSLRNESSAKENDNTKENFPILTSGMFGNVATGNGGKPTKAAFGSSSAASSSASSSAFTSTGSQVEKSSGSNAAIGALREVETNAVGGANAEKVKVDVRAKIKSLPVQDLMPMVVWPVCDVPQRQSVMDAVNKMWQRDAGIVESVRRDVFMGVRV